MSIKITGGQWNNRKLSVPKGEAVRPTTGRVRQSLFERLKPWLPEARVLDLFAGSGIIGFEALSRGASQVLALEKNGQHLQTIQANQTLLGLDAAQYSARKLDVFSWAERQAKADAVDWPPYTIIYIDPPYELSRGLSKLVTTLLAPRFLDANGVLLIEQGKNSTLAERVTPMQLLNYGDTHILWFEKY